MNPPLPLELFQLIARVAGPVGSKNLRNACRRLRALIFAKDVAWAIAGLLQYTEGIPKTWDWAARNGHIHLLEVYNSEMPPDKWECAFISAAKNGHPEIVAMMLDKGVDVHVRDDLALRHVADYQYDESRLHRVTLSPDTDLVAREKRFVETMRVVIDGGANVREHGRYVLDMACFEGCFDMVKLLLESGARDPNISLYYAMRTAASLGRVDIARLLLDAGADELLEDSRAVTLAAQYGHLDMVKLLLGRGTDVSTASKGHGALVEAASNRPICEFLLNAEAHVDSYTSALSAAAQSGHIDMVMLFLDRGAVVCDRTIRAAALVSQPDTLRMQSRWIIEKGEVAAYQPSDPQLYTTLLNQLLEVGPETLWSNKRGMVKAQERQHYEVTRLLVDLGAFYDGSWWLDEAAALAFTMCVIRKTEELTREKLKALKISMLEGAARKGFAKVVDLLLCTGAGDGKDFIEALYASIENGHANVVRLLLDEKPTDCWNDLMMMAVENGRVEVARVLLELGWGHLDEGMVDGFELAAS
ncbi:hypothetical protein HK097_000508, partial [Rhizophlyctis rosea]